MVLSGPMKKTLFIFCFLFSSLSFACGDLRNKPAYFNAKISCGTLFEYISEPTITLNGKTYAFALDSGDLSGECPDPNVGCYTPYINIVRRGNAICKAFGFGKYATSNDYGVWRDLPDRMAALKRNARGTYSPQVVDINHSRNEYIYVKTITCYRK